MNDLGMLLMWSALQATLVAAAAAAVYPFAARRRPAAGAAVAATGLIGSIAVLALALCPLPSWWDWSAHIPAAPAQAQATPAGPTDASAGADSDTAAAPPTGLSWPVAFVRFTGDCAGRAAAPFTERWQSGWAMAAIFFLIGIVLGLFRLAGGLWAVSDLRRRSRPVLDEGVLRWMQHLRERIGCGGRVELRECRGLGAPAAAGWLRPVILLPAAWREWDESELRAALAHELAHVRRRDYLLGLLARLGLALHFYHPLLYWLAGRLRLQQELAADGLAAGPAGGRDAYLLGLARLALRLSDRRPAGWPANPLLSRGMLMRRIQMLRITDDRFDCPAPRWSRVLVIALLAAAVIGVSALRCPAKAGGPSVYTAAFVDGGTVEDKTAAAPEPFDLSYLPPDAMGVACFRPSAVLGRPGLKKYAEAGDKGIAEYGTMLGLLRAFGLPVEEIAQISMTFRVVTDKKAKGAQSALLCGTPVVIRATKDFDWAKELKELIPGVKESQHGDRVIYHFPTDGPLAPMFGGAKMCYFVPDGRTIVFDTEEGLAARIDKGVVAPAWAEEFKRVQGGIATVVLDNRAGAWDRELSLRDQLEPHVAPFLKHTSWVVYGVGAEDDFKFEAAARFDSEETAEKAVNAIDGGLAAARDALATPETLRAALNGDADKNGKNATDLAWSFFMALVHEPDLKREGASVRLRCRAKADPTEILTAILEGEIGL